jgi:hypothetical protein
MAKPEDWTPERKAKAAEMIHDWKPWKHTTGPKTPEGKAKSSMNSLKTGYKSKEAIKMRRERAALIKEINRVFNELGL